MNDNCDIAIIGGGPVGMALALALRDSGLQVTVLEARKTTEASTDPRALALSYGSRLLLTQLGVWQDLTQISGIRAIHISQKNTFGRTLLKAAELAVPDLGYVLPYTTLQAALQHALEACAITCLQGATVSRLDNSVDPVSVFLVNGIKLMGRIESFDQFVVTCYCGMSADFLILWSRRSSGWSRSRCGPAVVPVLHHQGAMEL